MSDSEQIWRYPPNFPVLEADDIHVWCGILDQPTRSFRELEQTLSLDELDRLQEIPSALLRQRFIATHGLMRKILSRYLAIAPRQIEFSYDRRGKPCLAIQNGGHLEFNIARSRSLALYAVTKNREIGIDVEYLRQLEKAGIIASQFFSLRENAELRALSPELQLEAFMSCWTRKEAYFKARGIGITECAAQVEVTLHPGQEARLLSLEGDAGAAADWAIHSLAPAPGYVGAVAIKNPGARLTCWQWPGNAESILPRACRNALRSQRN
ncbi:MAG: phosphopantetheine-protein transferase [Chthoniobacteraceae bacterium]|nr:phosphopantetheine-protein transferase [Chthoniobacteraceae bacterium]